MNPMPQNTRRKIFVVLFMAIFLVTLGVGLIAPLLPVYARDLGASAFLIGLIFGSFSVTRTVFLPVFGTLSDLYGRKAFLVTGLFLYFLVSLLFAVTTEVTALVWIRLGQGFGSAMILPVAQAYIGELSPESKEGRVMGLFNLSLFAGLATGPLFGGIVMDLFGMRAAFLSMGVLTLIGSLLCLILLPREPAKRKETTSSKRATYGDFLRNPTVVALTVFRFSFTTCVGIVWAFLPIWASDQGGLSGFSIGVIVSLNVAVAGALMIPMGALADRVSKELLIVLGGLLSVVALLWLSAGTSFWSLLASNGLFGLAGGISLPAVMAATVIAGRGTRAMGSLMGLLAMAHSAGMFFGPIVAGYIMDRVPFERAFQAGALVMLLGTVFFVVVGRRKGREAA